jgi:NADH:ubiquinone oxidoreductase subunit 4 (subunit M)
MSLYIKDSPANKDISRREFFVLLPLVFLTLFLGVYPNIVLDALHPCVLNILDYFPVY